jgi:hypothetical protein
MLFHMKKTTLHIPDTIYREVKRRAVQRGQTVSDLVAEYLRRGLQEGAARGKLAPLPSFPDTGSPLVDVADRDALYRAMEEGERSVRR